MRRWVIGMICGVVLLSGCSKKAEPPAAINFSCDAHILYKDIEMDAHLIRTETGVLQMDINYPPSLEDLVITLDGDKVEVEMYGISFNLNPETLPVSGVAKGVLDALDTVADMEELPTFTESGARLTGKSQNGEFTLVSDPETGALLSLTIPDLPLEVTFSAFNERE